MKLTDEQIMELWGAATNEITFAQAIVRVAAEIGRNSHE